MTIDTILCLSIFTARYLMINKSGEVKQISVDWFCSKTEWWETYSLLYLYYDALPTVSISTEKSEQRVSGRIYGSSWRLLVENWFSLRIWRVFVYFILLLTPSDCLTLLQLSRNNPTIWQQKINKTTWRLLSDRLGKNLFF